MTPSTGLLCNFRGNFATPLGKMLVGLRPDQHKNGAQHTVPHFYAGLDEHQPAFFPSGGGKVTSVVAK